MRVSNVPVPDNLPENVVGDVEDSVKCIERRSCSDLLNTRYFDIGIVLSSVLECRLKNSVKRLGFLKLKEASISKIRNKEQNITYCKEGAESLCRSNLQLPTLCRDLCIWWGGRVSDSGAEPDDARVSHTVPLRRCSTTTYQA
ncbi:hypothetical protein AgCh_035855 [Apium graveolens]